VGPAASALLRCKQAVTFPNADTFHTSAQSPGQKGQPGSSGAGAEDRPGFCLGGSGLSLSCTRTVIWDPEKKGCRDFLKVLMETGVRSESLLWFSHHHEFSSETPHSQLNFKVRLSAIM
jgi:hypothetical protein